MKKKIVTAVMITAFLVPFLFIAVTVFLLPDAYFNAFTGVLDEKTERLDGTDSPKIVFVGGSAVAFGVVSPLVEEQLGLPAVNYGLYADIGIKAMLDLSLSGINEGDTVVIIPETDAQAYSLYFGAYSFLCAADGDRRMIFRASSDNYAELFGASWRFAAQKLKYVVSGEYPDPAGIYNAKSFDGYGDVRFERAGNVMPAGYISNPIRYSEEIVSPEFIDYVNGYVAACNKRGATVYFSFAPSDALAVASDDAEILGFYSYLSRALDCEIISYPSDHIYDYRYFYDTNFHVNDSGAILNTVDLIKDLKRAMGITTPTSVEIPPPPDPLTAEEGGDGIETTDPSLFLYEDRGDFLVLTGLSAEAKELPSIVIPEKFGGKPVRIIASHAFEGSAASSVTVTKAVDEIVNGAFYGCGSLRRIIILDDSPDAINVSDDLLAGVPRECVIVLANASRFDFVNHYFWQAYAERMVEK
ncbi:MAG: hypothetical protein J5940_00605 [Clostridia bacterium]|nr:hypothetical protein [Clostridia bacterium]